MMMIDATKNDAAALQSDVMAAASGTGDTYLTLDVTHLLMHDI